MRASQFHGYLLARSGSYSQPVLLVVPAFFFIPSFFVSGLITPVVGRGMERLSSDIFPVTHFMIIAREIFVKSLSLRALWREIVILATMYVSGMILALVTFRKRLM